jgi:hypothetical protein
MRCLRSIGLFHHVAGLLNNSFLFSPPRMSACTWPNGLIINSAGKFGGCIAVLVTDALALCALHVRHLAL